MGAAALGTAAGATNPAGWAMIGAQVLPEVLKYFTSRKQKKLAEKFGQTQRPAYEIPQALKDYLSQAKFNAAVSGLPGQGQLEKKLGRQTAATLGMGKNMSATNAIANAAAADYSTKQALEDTAYDAAKYKASQQRELYGAETAMAKQQLAQWDWDKKQRYLDAMAAQSALDEGAQKNAMGALEGLVGAAQTAGMMGLFGAGAGAAGGAAAGGATNATGEAVGQSVVDALSGMTAGGAAAGAKSAAPTAPNWAAGPMLGTDFSTLRPGASFQDPNDPSYNYTRYPNGTLENPDTPLGYAIFKNGKYANFTTANERAGGSIADYDPFISSIMQPRVPGSDMAFPDMQLSPIGERPEFTGDMNDYGPGARRAMRRAGGETSQFNVSLPSQITDNWTNDYFGMEMPTAYGYGNTWNDIMSRIGTQYGLGDVYSDGFNTNLNRQYSRFNPFV
jgi:hypothetical protein